jgi:hypothetical protein
MLILNAYATTNNPLSATRSVMYMSGQPNACNSTQLSQNPPVMLNIVYFVKNNTLWRRVVMPSNYASVGCNSGVVGAPWQIPSCSPSVTNSYCKSQDERLVDGIQNGGFSVSYYNAPDAATANSIASDASQSDAVRQAALQTAATVGITINASGTVSGRDISQSSTVRVTSPNNNITPTSDVAWSSFSLQNNWTDYGSGYYTNGYRRTKDGVVILKGLIKRSGTITSGEIIGTLPVGYRPSEELIFETCTNSNASSRVDIFSDGTVRVIAGDPGWLSLDGIKFLPSDAPYTFTNMAYYNSWTTYGSPYPAAAYTVDADGRVFTKGLIRSGTTTDGTWMALLPAGARPSESLLIAEHHSGTWGMIRVAPDGSIQSTNLPAGASSYLSLQANFYPSSYTGWTNLVLQNSWVSYGSGYAAPQYTKASDGLVSLKGLIKSGTVTGDTILATLPAGFRPGARVLYNGISSNGTATYSRIDIDSGGSIRIETGYNGWLSLDGMSFYADQ